MQLAATAKLQWGLNKCKLCQRSLEQAKNSTSYTILYMDIHAQSGSPNMLRYKVLNKDMIALCVAGHIKEYSDFTPEQTELAQASSSIGHGQL